MIASSLLQDSCNSSSAGESTDIPTIVQNLFKCFGFPAYLINNALEVTSDEVFFRRIGAYFGKAGFQFFHAIQGFLEAPFLGFTEILNIFL
jgi:hypothetical protein